MHKRLTIGSGRRVGVIVALGMLVTIGLVAVTTYYFVQIHITVTGPYVVDTNALHRVLYQGRAAENWAEIHPVWAIRVEGPGGPGPNQFGLEFGEGQRDAWTAVDSTA